MPTYTLAAAISAEIDIRKSRFIVLAIPVADHAAAMLELDTLRALHPGATHVCWALRRAANPAFRTMASLPAQPADPGDAAPP